MAPHTTGRDLVEKKQKWVKFKASKVKQEAITDGWLDMESDDLLKEGSSIRFGTVQLRLGVNMAFSLPAVFGASLEEKRRIDSSEK